jgi:hypothetical protein
VSLFGCCFGNRFSVSKTAKPFLLNTSRVWLSVLKTKTKENKNIKNTKYGNIFELFPKTGFCFQRNSAQNTGGTFF